MKYMTYWLVNISTSQDVPLYDEGTNNEAILNGLVITNHNDNINIISCHYERGTENTSQTMNALIVTIQPTSGGCLSNGDTIQWRLPL
jgi:hypothetical protein